MHQGSNDHPINTIQYQLGIHFHTRDGSSANVKVQGVRGNSCLAQWLVWLAQLVVHQHAALETQVRILVQARISHKISKHNTQMANLNTKCLFQSLLFTFYCEFSALTKSHFIPVLGHRSHVLWLSVPSCSLDLPRIQIVSASTVWIAAAPSTCIVVSIYFKVFYFSN